MTEPSSMKDWQVDESSDPDSQWQLLETEQELPSELTLEETGAASQDWQPVEYAEPESSGGRNWILPSFIILAMIAVVAYIAWLGLNGSGLFPATTTEVAPSPTVADPVAGAIAPVEIADEPTATPEPEPEPIATVVPTPEPVPTPELVEQRYATIDSEYGLNARLSPDPDGEVVEVLDDGAKYAVTGEQGDRLELILEDGRRVWVATEFVIESSELVPRDEAVGLPVDSVEAPQGESQPEGSELPDAPTETTGITPPEPFTDLVPPDLALLVLIDGGVNARTADSIDSDIILTIPQGAAFSTLGQNAAGDWLRIELPNGTGAWVFRDTVETRGAIDSLPVLNPDGQPTEPPADELPVVEEATSGETTPEVSETETATSTVVLAEPITTTTDIDDGVAPEITVGLIGVKARVLPELSADVAEVLNSGTVLPVTGRTADSTWVAITLENGDVAWILAGTVDLSVAPATLPVVEP